MHEQLIDCIIAVFMGSNAYCMYLHFLVTENEGQLWTFWPVGLWLKQKLWSGRSLRELLADSPLDTQSAGFIRPLTYLHWEAFVVARVTATLLETNVWDLDVSFGLSRSSSSSCIILSIQTARVTAASLVQV